MIRWAAPGPYEVGFSTRVGGVSEGPFASLNLGRMTGDGFGVDVPQHATTLWLAAWGGPEYHLRLARHHRLRVELGIAWLLVGRHQFVLDTNTPVHEPSLFSGRADVGWEFIF